MRRSFVGAAVMVLASIPIAVGGVSASAGNARPASETQEATEQEYVVLYADGASAAAAHEAITAAGGTIVSENTDVGVATVTSSDAGFTAAVAAQPSLAGSAKNRIIGEVPKDVNAAGETKKVDQAQIDASTGKSSRWPSRHTPGKHIPTAEPLADLQWDMQQIGATPTGSYRYEPGDRGVLVGIIDTGVDGSHPDIAPNFNKALSRNFTVDIPVDANGDEIDGPCEDEADHSCNDANDVDEDGHGTHVASTIAAPINGIGIAGVAPKVTIVNLRAGQDSGYFFLQPSVDALTYAGRNGIDVVNMSYYVDPWLFNCSSNSEDSPEDQAEQRMIVKAMQRALDFARARGVTLVSAAGNGATDYTKELIDGSSPDFASVPGEVAYTRDLVDPASCISMPSEGRGVISVSSTGPSTRKAYYSDYGNGYVDVAAPGGDAYDTADNKLDYAALVLAAYPKALAIANGEIDANGDPVVPDVVKSCDGSVCAYYQYLQGTSMASPHAAGVAALIVSRYGVRDRVHGGLTLSPVLVEAIMKRTATKTACPVPNEFTYTRLRLQPDGTYLTSTSTALCEGTRNANGFYGRGIVSAIHAIGR